MDNMNSDKPIILAVDDAPTNLRILAEALQHDYLVKLAINGPDALAVAQSDPPPDLILLDVMMPEMDGYEVLRRLQAHPSTQRIPVIFVTAKATETDEESGLKLGAVDYITKPISIPVTKARVRTHIDLKLRADQLAELALIDPLTQIPNRRRLDESLANEWKRALREGKPLSILMIDIDHFKDYNDHYGHTAGDACLCRVAAALMEGVSRPGDMVARYGGEEFAVILPATDLQPATHIANHLRERILNLEIPHHRSSTAPTVSVSIGCASTHGKINAASPVELLRQADTRLYQSKKLGRNCVSAE